MSNPIAALPDAAYAGYAEITATNLRGMIALRGDLASTKLRDAVTKLTSCTVPKPRKINAKAANAVAWMSTDELLILLPYSKVGAVLKKFEVELRGQHFLAVDVSDARASFRIDGPKCREIIAKISPANVAHDSFQPGQIIRSRVGQVAAAFWIEDANSIELVCFRSVADYVFGLLKNAAKPGGEVDFF